MIELFYLFGYLVLLLSLVAFYFLMIKPHQDEKLSKTREQKTFEDNRDCTDRIFDEVTETLPGLRNRMFVSKDGIEPEGYYPYDGSK